MVLQKLLEWTHLVSRKYISQVENVAQYSCKNFQISVLTR